jgi:cob(I)alamin adenosyltransferase
METWIDMTSAGLPELTQFVLPGGSELAARLHVARTVCRRAERTMARLADADLDVPSIAFRYINRLGDLLFVIAHKASAG